jgi:hypothetical protein
VISGNRVFIASIIGAGLLLAAARGPGALTPRKVFIAEELLPESPGIALLDCAADAPSERVELRFERIAADPDPDEMRRLLNRGAHRTVAFEWNSATGELAYGAPVTFTPPADRGAAPSYPVRASCVSR